MMGAYAAFFNTSRKEELRYFFTDSFTQTLSTLIYITLTLLLYHAASKSLFASFTWAMIAWYVIAAQFLVRTNGHLVKTISNEVTTGEVASLMLRPVYYPFTLVAVQFGAVVVQTSALAIVLVPFGIIIAGTGALSAQGTIAFIILLIGSALLNACIALCLGLIAFWTEDATPYDWIYNKCLLVLGGTIVPLDLLPRALGSVASYLPPAYVIYHPARVLVDFTWEGFAKAAAGQTAYIIVFGAMAYFIYSRAAKKVSINGG